MERSPRVFRKTEENLIKIVPWTSMLEWKEVRHQIFSSNLSDKIKGYETLRIWKARCPTTLPLSVECTFMFLGVEIEDKQFQTSSNKTSFHDVETKLRYMYSMAITRFINLVTSEDPKKALAPTMIGLAQLKGISEWVVNLRHDVSHGVNMPALSTLQIAADEAYNWLFESYWRNEESTTWDWIFSKPQSNNTYELTELLDIWQSIHLYIKTNVIVDAQINDKYLRQKLMSMRSEMKSEKHIGKTWKLKHAVTYIEKMIFSLIKHDSDATELITLICDSKGFLPEYDVLALHNLNVQKDEMVTSLPQSFMLQWQEFFCLLHWGGFLPELLDKLLEKCCCEFEDAFRQNIAALWIHYIAKGLNKLKKIQKLLVRTGFQLKTDLKVDKFSEFRDNINNVASNISMDLLNEKGKTDVSANYPRLMGALRLPSDVTPPDSSVLLDFIKKAMVSPTKWHKIFISSLLDLVSDVLPKGNKESLITLMSLYMGEMTSNKQDVSEVKTLSHLIQETGLTNGHVLETNQNDEDLPPDHGWTLFSTSGDVWQGLCIGVLPWQNKICPEDFILPCNWIPCSSLASEDMEICQD